MTVTTSNIKRDFSPFSGAISSIRDSFKRTLHSYKYRPPKSRSSKMLVLIPAHNEAESLSDTLNSILNQTRRPDRVVVISDNSTDDTVKIASRFRGVTVMETVDNEDRKVGALTQGWRRWGAGFDYVAGVDADTVLHPECLEKFESEMERDKTIGGVCARFTFDQEAAVGPMSSFLVRMQRIEFSQWVADIGHRKREAHVLGGQASLFRGSALDVVADKSHRNSPWSSATMVEDALLSVELQESRFKTKMSPAARAYVGAMHTLGSLWAQRLKWARGNARLALDQGYRGSTKVHWRQQLGHFLDLSNRVLFLLMLSASISQGKHVWSWWWVIPPALAVLVNLRAAWRAPHRQPMDVLLAVLLFPAEIYLWFVLAVHIVAWGSVLGGSERDGWARQYRSENGQVSYVGRFIGSVAVLSAAAVGVMLGWGSVPSSVQDTVLSVGWGVVMVLTILSCIRMVYKFFRPSHGFRP